MNKQLRVAVYMRRPGADADNPFFTIQRLHYEQFIPNHEGWVLAGYYDDRGAGALTVSRPELMRMLEDCEAGKIDLVVVKSLTRLSHYVKEAWDIIRRLLELSPPVGVFLEEVNAEIWHRDDLILTVLEALAIEESRHKKGHLCCGVNHKMFR